MSLISYISSLLRTLVAVVALVAVTEARGETPSCDFSFETREGRQTTLLGELRAVSPDAAVVLLLFDPDCGECHALEQSLMADSQLADSVAAGLATIIAVYPCDGVPEADDPNMAAYRRVCGELPSGWTVGIDHGSLFETDACVWDNLPLLMRFRAGEMIRTEDVDITDRADDN